jgi:hypothetical protein
MAQSPATSDDHCSWCGAPVAAGEGYRLLEAPGERRAAFCRLEHVVPWGLRGAHWEPTTGDQPPDDGPESCSECGAALTDVRVTLVHYRGERVIVDAFCGVEHACAWAKSGGRYR